LNATAQRLDGRAIGQNAFAQLVAAIDTDLEWNRTVGHECSPSHSLNLFAPYPSSTLMSTTIGKYAVERGFLQRRLMERKEKARPGVWQASIREMTALAT
jgi:hypothetical protein